MKPVKGGRPPRESRISAEVTVRVGFFDQVNARVLIFVEADTLNVRKAVDVMIIYIPSVRSVSCGIS